MSRHIAFAVGLSTLAGLLVFLGGWVGQGVWSGVFFAGAMVVLFYLIVVQQLERRHLPVALAAGCFMLSGCLIADHVRFGWGATTTQATALRVGPPVGQGRASGRTAHLRVAFEDRDGKDHVIHAVALRGQWPERAESIPVLYHPDAPERARVGGELFWHLPLAIALLGGFLLLVGAAMGLWRRWMSPPERTADAEPRGG